VNDDTDFDPPTDDMQRRPGHEHVLVAVLYYKDPQDGVLSIVKTSHTHYYIVIGDGYMRR
jgi:hypothetical protein